VGARYIGSKSRVAELVVDLAGEPGAGRFVDAFCGTGAVAAAAARRTWPVVLNDSLSAAVVMATGAVVGRDNVPFRGFGGYENACTELDALPGTPGFLTRQYSPAAAAVIGFERRYFTTDNAARLDAMRSAIHRWSRSGRLTPDERDLLLADLMFAANSVANTSGTYGCFLSDWSASALRPVRLSSRQLPDRHTRYRARIGDVTAVPTTDDDVVYYDPPYTKRQYAAYYHLLETLTVGDEPAVDGVTGLRPWQSRASEFCYKSRAATALCRLVTNTRARRILLSYSSEGHVTQDRLLTALTAAGDIRVHTLEAVGRYRPNSMASANGSRVTEYVIEIVPNPRRRCGDAGTAGGERR